MVDISRFINARPGAACADPQTAFMDALRAAGFKGPRLVVSGRIDRIDGPEDKPGKRSGWYCYNEIPDKHDGAVIGVANYGCWKTGISESWSSKSDQTMTQDERMNYQAARHALKLAQEAEERARHEEAAQRAAQIVASAPDCVTHDYLTRKGVGPSTGLKIGQDGRLIIPMYKAGGIVSLEYIFPNGDKRRLTGGQVKGAWFRIDGDMNRVYIAEGYATARSVHEATGATVYAAFNAGNLYEVAADVKAAHAGAMIIIAGDDDTETAGNPGRTKALQAADGLGIDVIFPPGFVDFNDFHLAKGMGALRDFLNPKAQAYEKPERAKEATTRPPGILGDIFDYYNATSGNRQEGFAVQTSLALASVVLGRCYKTSLENYPSLYLLNVGKSGTGKEHMKTVIERLLYESGHAGLIAGDGYTSAGAVFSALLDRPKHISVIDEFGRYLEAGRDLGNGNHNQREANTKLMESIGRAHSVIRPPTYSTMTLKKDVAAEMKNRQVFNPSITLLTMTTPETLFKTLDMGAIKDGFVNRFIICISDAERAIRQHKPPIAAPQRILDWIRAVTDRHGRPHLAMEPAQAIPLEFSEDALKMQIEFQQYCIDKANYLERFGMAELPGRSNEMAMRLSLICALARDPMAKVISGDDMFWSCDYIRQKLDATIERLKVSISSSAFEGQKKEILADLRERGAEGITWAMMMKNAPYSQHKQKDLKDILLSLRDADLAIDEPFVNPNGGRPTVRWMAVK